MKRLMIVALAMLIAGCGALKDAKETSHRMDDKLSIMLEQLNQALYDVTELKKGFRLLGSGDLAINADEKAWIARNLMNFLGTMHDQNKYAEEAGEEVEMHAKAWYYLGAPDVLVFPTYRFKTEAGASGSFRNVTLVHGDMLLHEGQTLPSMSYEMAKNFERTIRLASKAILKSINNPRRTKEQARLDHEDSIFMIDIVTTFFGAIDLREWEGVVEAPAGADGIDTTMPVLTSFPNTDKFMFSTKSRLGAAAIALAIARSEGLEAKYETRLKALSEARLGVSWDQVETAYQAFLARIES